MFEVIHSRHRSDYFRIAFKYWTSPQHVWELAHGEHRRTQKDKDIVHELAELGIVHRYKKHRHHSEEENDELDNEG